MTKFAASLVGLALLAASPVSAATLAVEVRVAGSALPPVAKAELLAAPASGVGEAQTAAVAVPGRVAFTVAPGSVWEVSVAAPGYWSRPKAAVAGGSTVQLDLLPAGEVTGEARVLPGQPSPERVSLRIQSSPDAKPAIPESETSCPVRERRFRCAVPAGSLDLRVRARGFVSHYRWGVQVTARGTKDLGALALEPGAGVVGWVASPSRDFRFADCRVELSPRAAGLSPSLDDEARRGGITLSARVGPRGFFQIPGVPPGSYELVVRHPSYAPARISPVEVLPGAETEVKPLELQPPVAVEVALDPPRDPYGQPWTVELLQRGRVPNVLVSAARSPASAEGVFRAAGLEPGAYVLKVYGSYTSSWLDEELDVGPGMAPHFVRLPFLEVRGEVTLGGEPLFALLWFGGAHGPVKIPAKTDREGKFEVTLPVRESWRVEVVNPPMNVFSVVPELAVRKAPGKSFARVAIDLPDTSISGQVVDEEGRPVVEARVRGSGPADYLESAASGPEARFELRGLSPGTWTFDAVAGRFDTGLSSESAIVELGPRQRVEDVRLVMRRKRKLSGLVVGPSGSGIPGAKVTGLVEQEARLLGSTAPEAVTDVNGQFTLGLPAAAEGLQLTVLAPGFAVTQVRVDPRRSDPLILPVRQVGGTLVLSYEGLAGHPALLASRISLFHDFLLPPVAALTSWAEINGAVPDDLRRPRIPLLEPGHYTACLDVNPLVYRSGRLAPGLESRCVSGELAPFGELVLKLPGDA